MCACSSRGELGDAGADEAIRRYSERGRSSGRPSARADGRTGAHNPAGRGG